MRSGFYAGSFDPFTIAHLDIARRALKMVDRLVIGIGYNIAKNSAPDMLQSRIADIQRAFRSGEPVEVIAYNGLTVDVAREYGCNVLIRGLRNVSDFENEMNLAQVNRNLAPELDTVFIPASPELAFVSSSMVRELMAFGHDVTQYLPVTGR